VRAKRKGIILMHDIHNRTAAMLPALLKQLKNGGYKVVALQYRRSRMPEVLVSAGNAGTKSRQMEVHGSRGKERPSASLRRVSRSIDVRRISGVETAIALLGHCQMWLGQLVQIRQPVKRHRRVGMM